jgi:hypothetical protein
MLCLVEAVVYRKELFEDEVLKYSALRITIKVIGDLLCLCTVVKLYILFCHVKNSV